MHTKYTILALDKRVRDPLDQRDDSLRINNSGHIVGLITDCGDEIAFLHDGEHLRPIPLPVGHRPRTIVINDAGQIAGSILASDYYNFGRFIFAHDRARCEYFSLIAGKHYFTHAINNQGHILVQYGGGSAFVVKNGDLHAIGTPDHRVQAFGMNDAGHVVGAGRNPDLRQRAFIADGRDIQLLGTLDLGPTEKLFSGAHAINDMGHVVGCSGASIRGEVHAFLYDGAQMHDLGTQAGMFSWALAINNQGDIVGYAHSAHSSDGEHRALLWRGRTLLDLNDTIAQAGWVLHKAVDINDAGQIVGWGTYMGEGRAFLMNPVEA